MAHELILGGVKSGKSSYGELRATLRDRQIVYVATAEGRDSEMQARILRHRKDRPEHWIVVEEPVNLADTIARYDSDQFCIIVDCLTLWISNLLALPDESFSREMDAFLSNLPSAKCDVIMISNETNLGVIPVGSLSRRFCDEAGLLHQRLATICTNVTLMVAGIPMAIKPKVTT